MSSDTGSLKRKAGDDTPPLPQAPRRIKVINYPGLWPQHDYVLNRKLYRLWIRSSSIKLPQERLSWHLYMHLKN
ncbi:hypothetical protein Q9L58_007810 [Maublancomyces gigas]|uniref:Uncharacterized protein n=1 Tax=Discina gigas TaxID=1032678 RepID=A0ABR3GBL3_9PEZI